MSQSDTLGGHWVELDNIATELRFQAEALRRLGFRAWSGDVDEVAREIGRKLEFCRTNGGTR